MQADRRRRRGERVDGTSRLRRHCMAVTRESGIPEIRETQENRETPEILGSRTILAILVIHVVMTRGIPESHATLETLAATTLVTPAIHATPVDTTTSVRRHRHAHLQAKTLAAAETAAAKRTTRTMMTMRVLRTAMVLSQAVASRLLRQANRPTDTLRIVTRESTVLAAAVVVAVVTLTL